MATQDKSTTRQNANTDLHIERVPEDERLSALVDGELPFSQCAESLAAAYQAEGKAQWGTYHLVGDTLRSEGLLAVQSHTSPEFMQRFALALEKEPHHLPVQAPVLNRPVAWIRKAIPSVALAASVAAVSWVVMPQLRSNSPVTVATSTQGSDEAFQLTSGLKDNTQASLSIGKTDAILADNNGMIRDASLDAYLQAHGQYAPRAAAPIMRAVNVEQAACGASC